MHQLYNSTFQGQQFFQQEVLAVVCHLMKLVGTCLLRTPAYRYLAKTKTW
jgi:hypothetical protein